MVEAQEAGLMVEGIEAAVAMVGVAMVVGPLEEMELAVQEARMVVERVAEMRAAMGEATRAA